MKAIDFNCDMGEMPEALADGTQEELMRYISSANIACGGHAGDADMMRVTIEQAVRYGVSVGAHPGYEDRENFGRNELQIAPKEIANSVYRQIVALDAIAKQLGVTVAHVKAHGALYNQAARDRTVAGAISEGVRRWNRHAVIIGLAGSAMLEEFRAAGFSVAAEAFADRRYEGDGSLRLRKFPDALLRDTEEAAAQALRIVEQGMVIAADGASVPVQADTICIHGDTPGASQIAAEIHRRFRQAGISIKALSAK